MSANPIRIECPAETAALTRRALDYCKTTEEKAIVALAGFYDMNTTRLRMIHNRDVRAINDTEGAITTTTDLGLRVEILVTGETWEYVQSVQRVHPFGTRPEMPLFLGRIRILPAETRAALLRGEYVDPNEVRRTKAGVSDLFRRLSVRMGFDGKTEGFVHHRRIGKGLDLLARLREGWHDGPLSPRLSIPTEPSLSA